MRKLLALTLFFYLGGCSADYESRARAVMADAGYSEVEFYSVTPEWCDNVGERGFDFLARSPSGRDVAGAVCVSNATGPSIVITGAL